MIGDVGDFGFLMDVEINEAPICFLHLFSNSVLSNS
ncbi:uncharacterized protein METZ01_LOCUS181229 [marine metagenome]|uniref:Uncharacterized protein n=1 Tax=marine metagenome TaxID=408172 RepID=A0A382CQL5_9ZZZZ